MSSLGRCWNCRTVACLTTYYGVPLCPNCWWPGKCYECGSLEVRGDALVEKDGLYLCADCHPNISR